VYQEPSHFSKHLGARPLALFLLYKATKEKAYVLDRLTSEEKGN
jgi:hypothetical protein